MANFVNLTPHDVTIINADGTVLRVITKTGIVARVAQSLEQLDSIDGVTMFKTRYGEVENVPAPQDGTYYIVSSLVAARCEGRNDIIVPAEFVRDAGGNIIGCKGFQKQQLDENLGRQAAEIKTVEDLVRFAARHDMSGWSDCDDAWARRIYEIKCKEFGIEP